MMEQGEGDDSVVVPLREALSRSAIQAIRAAADAGDYGLIGRIVHSVLEYGRSTTITSSSSSGNGNANHPLVEPRIFAEAIDGLTRTKASMSKIKQIWTLLWEAHNDKGNNDNDNDTNTHQHSKILSAPPSARELNVMIAAFVSRNKVRAALDLFLSDMIPDPDSYTASTLFTMLANSIQDGQEASSSSSSSNSSSSSSSNNNLEKTNKSIIENSPCWQWNEALRIVDKVTNAGLQQQVLNNHAYAALLKVNERSSEVFTERGKRHFGARAAMDILEKTKKDGLSPDIVTCSAILSAFDKGYQWKAAVTLLATMRKVSMAVKKGDTAILGGWSLPFPNVYAYATTISACARCNELDAAMDILDEMRNETPDDLNRWVYNAALAACVNSKQQNPMLMQAMPRRRLEKGETKSRLETALSLLDGMEEDALFRGMDTVPNTVSYNTALAAIDSRDFEAYDGNRTKQTHGPLVSSCFESSDTWMAEEQIAWRLLERMRLADIPRDSITYRNAIMACRQSSQAAYRLLESALADKLTSRNAPKQDTKNRRLSRKDGNGLVFVFNAALSVCRLQEDIETGFKILMSMQQHSVQLNSVSLAHVIHMIGGKAQNSVLSFIELLAGGESQNMELSSQFGVDFDALGFQGLRHLLDEKLFSTGISVCLKHNDLDTARLVLSMMKARGFTPSEDSVNDTIVAYSRMAMASAGEEFRLARESKKGKKEKMTKLNPQYITSVARAEAALQLMKTLSDTPAKTMAAVSEACIAAGMWDEGRTVLRSMHRAAIREERAKLSKFNKHGAFDSKEMLHEFPRLHRSLLKLCARSGQINPALWIVDDIQDFSTRMIYFRERSEDEKDDTVDAPAVSFQLLAEPESEAAELQEAIDGALTFDSLSASRSTRGFGMRGEDWKLLMIAASKSHKWRVCIGTLQFLRPFVEETNPKNKEKIRLDTLDRQYDRLARALTSAILCFEIRGQYAWAIRAIGDWIQWSNRRPRKEAVIATCRLLASRNQGEEVSKLVARVLAVPAARSDSKEEKISSNVSYEETVYTAAITALHKNGMYDCADDLYAAAVASNHLPFALMDNEADYSDDVTINTSTLMLDLHGMTTAIAHSAVRVTLQREVQVSSWCYLDQEVGKDSLSVWDTDVTIITGRGKNSVQHMRPILRPEVQRMLSEEFYPPLSTISVPGNMGALVVPGADVNAWLIHQRQQKGARLLVVADVLKYIASGDRLKQSLSRKVE
eukprot:scaffold7003_cov60-Attheya_sp.AAC.4